MKCSRKEFEDKIVAFYASKKYFYLDYDDHGRSSCYALDSGTIATKDAYSNVNLASHVWFDGSVIKDSTGLFNITVVKYVTIKVGVPPEDIEYKPITLELKAKCECGAWSVNSNRHSTWCAIKE